MSVKVPYEKVNEDVNYFIIRIYHNFTDCMDCKRSIRQEDFFFQFEFFHNLKMLSEQKEKNIWLCSNISSNTTCFKWLLPVQKDTNSVHCLIEWNTETLSSPWNFITIGKNVKINFGNDQQRPQVNKRSDFFLPWVIICAAMNNENKLDFNETRTGLGQGGITLSNTMENNLQLTQGSKLLWFTIVNQP